MNICPFLHASEILQFDSVAQEDIIAFEAIIKRLRDSLNEWNNNFFMEGDYNFFWFSWAGGALDQAWLNKILVGWLWTISEEVYLVGDEYVGAVGDFDMCFQMFLLAELKKYLFLWKWKHSSTANLLII